MRVLVSGGAGYIGSHMVKRLLDESIDVVIVDDLSGVRADRAVLINAAAYTAVDAAETDEEAAQVVNGLAPGWLAEEMARRGRLVHVSTDYVFDGTASEPYPVDAPIAPRSAYGRTKAAGERAVAGVGGDATVVRTAWVYGRHGANFVRTMIRLEGQHDTLTVVDDQVGSPTWSADLAAGLVELGAREGDVPPMLHRTNSGQVSWCGFARAVFEEIGADPERVRPISTAEFPRPAPRPAYSVLSTERYERLTGCAPDSWREGLEEYVALRPTVSS